MLKACSSALPTKMISLLQDGGAFEEAFSGHSWDGFGHNNRTGRQHWIKHVKTYYSKQLNAIYIYTHFMRCFPHTHIYINVPIYTVCQHPQRSILLKYIYMQCANILNHPFAVWVGSMTCFCRITVMPRKLLNVVCNGDCFGPKRPVFRGGKRWRLHRLKTERCTSWQPKPQRQRYRSIIPSSSLGWINFGNPCPAPRDSRDGSTEDTTLHTASPARAFQ